MRNDNAGGGPRHPLATRTHAPSLYSSALFAGTGGAEQRPAVAQPRSQ